MNKLLNFLLAPFGLCRVVGYQNIYRSGFYHRVGKPMMYDRHPGDIYPDRVSAKLDIDPEAKHLYVATCKVVWWEEREPHVNSCGSKPVPIAQTRRKLLEDGGEYVDGVWRMRAVENGVPVWEPVL